MRLPSDPMRRMAWVLVLVGLAVIALSPLYARHESNRLYNAWLDADKHELPSYDVSELDRRVRRATEKLQMITSGFAPAWTVASPWPCAGAGGLVTAFGVLLLAVRRPERQAKQIAALALALLLAGCATATTAEYIDLKTGQTEVCRDDHDPGAWIALVCIPCYFAAKGNAYADCKNRLEEQGLVRRDARTDAILRHLDPKLRDTLPSPSAAPAPTAASTPLFCRQRANSAGGWDRARWSEEYRRCMAWY